MTALPEIKAGQIWRFKADPSVRLVVSGVRADDVVAAESIFDDRVEPVRRLREWYELVGDRRRLVMDALDSVLEWRGTWVNGPHVSQTAEQVLGELADAVLAALDRAT